MDDLSNKNVIMILAPSGFRDEEYSIPRKVLEQYGANIKTASLNKDVVGMLGRRDSVDMLLEEVKSDYDAIIFVGGVGTKVYFDDPEVHELAREMFNKEMVVAAICIAPSILANAGLLEGKKATSYPSEKENLEKHGATYTGEKVTVDGKIVTGSGPAAAEEFGEAIAKLL
jgi:protease I